MKAEGPIVKKFNIEFGKMDDAVRVFIKRCAKLGSPIKTISVACYSDGGHKQTAVRCIPVRKKH
jgi:hypothetical protein